MTAATVCAMAVLLAFCAFSLREFGWRGAPLFCLIAALALLSQEAGHFGELVGLLGDIRLAEECEEAAGATLKILGVGYASRLCTDVCSELGEMGLSRAVQTVFQIEILWIALPFLRRLLTISLSVLV